MTERREYLVAQMDERRLAVRLNSLADLGWEFFHAWRPEGTSHHVMVFVRLGRAPDWSRIYSTQTLTPMQLDEYLEGHQKGLEG